MEQIEKQLEINFQEHKTLMNKIDDLTKAVAEIQISIAGLPEKIFEKADERYASKVVEKAVYAVIGAVCLGVVYIALSMILNHPITLP
jgi:Txe/YoeB family toxin of Txe-Axe toxin-antitoxin module